MVAEAMVAVEDIVRISRHIATISQANSRGHATNKTTTSSKQARSHLTTSHNSRSSTMALELHITSITTTTRDTKLPRDTNKQATHNSHSMARQHSRPSNLQHIKITRIIMPGINSSNSKLGTEALAVPDISRCCGGASRSGAKQTVHMCSNAY